MKRHSYTNSKSKEVNLSPRADPSRFKRREDNIRSFPRVFMGLAKVNIKFSSTALLSGVIFSSLRAARSAGVSWVSLPGGL